MTEEMKQKRDELAERYDVNQDVDDLVCRNIYDENSRKDFKAGFDACYKLMEAENAELRKKLDWLLSEARILESAETLKTFEKENLFLKSRIEKLIGVIKSAKGFVDAYDNVGFTKIKIDEALKQDEGEG